MELKFDVNGDTILLRSADLCYELCRSRKRTDKGAGGVVESWEPFLYPATLEHGLTRIMDMKIKTSTANTLSELRDVIEEVRKEICYVWRISLDGVTESTNDLAFENIVAELDNDTRD